MAFEMNSYAGLVLQFRQVARSRSVRCESGSFLGHHVSQRRRLLPLATRQQTGPRLLEHREPPRQPCCLSGSEEQRCDEVRTEREPSAASILQQLNVQHLAVGIRHTTPCYPDVSAYPRTYCG
jgi:hypothetical protein